MSLAIEKRSAEEALASLPAVRARVDALLARVSTLVDLGADARALDVGAAQGLYVAELRRHGLDAIGVDPWPGAVDASHAIAQQTGLETQVIHGSAESLPVGDETISLVTAFSVLEHVGDLDAALREAARVLRPGGGFYFYTTSALCPRQYEIRRFPLFPWYPGPLKRRIMDWAVEKRPALVNYTRAPAYHWFTPRMVRRISKSAGFSSIYDRWDLRAEAPEGGMAQGLVRVVRSVPGGRVAADVLVPDSAYLLVK